MKEALEDLENFVTEVVVHNRRGIRASLLRVAFRGLAVVYSTVVSFRLMLYRERFIHDHHLGVPVVSVGNLTVGGTGKTPVVELLSKSLRDKGRRVCILSRGYKSKRQKKAPFLKRLGAKLGLVEKPEEIPPRIVSDGEKVLLDSHDAGDEPFMLARNCPGVPVVVDKNRVKAGAHAIKHLGADVLVLGDRPEARALLRRLGVPEHGCLAAQEVELVVGFAGAPGGREEVDAGQVGGGFGDGHGGTPGWFGNGVGGSVPGRVSEGQ